MLSLIVWTLLLALSLLAAQPSANKTPVVAYSTFSLLSDGAADDQPHVRALSTRPPRPAASGSRIIVKLKHPHTESLARAETISRALQASQPARRALMDAVTHTAETTIHHLNSLSMDTVDLPPGVDAVATCESALLVSSDIDICEPDALVASTSGRRLRARAAQEPNRWVPNDPIFEEQWEMASIDMPEAWAVLSEQQEDEEAAGPVGKGPVVGVIDSGVDYTHPDLKDAMWVNEGEIAGNGIDDDGNGFVDDIHGWAWCDGPFYPDTSDGDPMDTHGHGTHSAGTIAATANNRQGIAGIAGVAFGREKIMALKVLCSGGQGSFSDTIQAINYAVAMGATLTSNSYGGGFPFRAREAAIRKAEEANMLFVAAAGNEHVNTDITKHYPSSLGLDSIISAGATDSDGKRACFSNYGLESVDVFAPGTDIYSTMPGGKYASASGTSVAAPFVAGVAALLWSTDLAQSFRDIKGRILATSEKMDSLDCLCVTGGQVNARKAVRCVDCKWTPPVRTSECKSTPQIFAGSMLYC
ncbi:unnamed protein product [Vitrella brassicaformis CCMP3155]|uniref:subtilisin n=2 Tax=Vitrella brassicaformis TaxID=1169539 RepID=A0A0G4H737_VITBC|nr:unnamed protein product [Vitrella brassicaformis CCMP3155]|eukprot:CEM39664.1 unnamed protein product [Vitrella brassicaformis CCMP3155]